MNVCNIFQEIKKKIADLSKMYMDVVKNHGIKEYTFGLDAFHFQSKLIEHEYENMQKLLNTITNRFYCEYYKLYKIILEYVHTELKLNINITSKVVFPAYKDLEKHINYDFSLTVEIQSMSVKYINALNDYLQSKNKELYINSTRQSKCGINIDHIVHYQSYTNALIAEQIRMFIRYMDALNKHHTKYINRLYNVSKHLLDDVNADITTTELVFEPEPENNDNENYNENEYEVISMNERASPVPTKFAPTKFEPTSFEPTPTSFAPTPFATTPTPFAPTPFAPTPFAPTPFDIYAVPTKRALPSVSSPALARASPLLATEISLVVNELLNEQEQAQTEEQIEETPKQAPVIVEVPEQPIVEAEEIDMTIV
jgi:hypothetical protein